MLSRSALLLALGFCLLGVVGGAFGALIVPVSYQAEAFVVVYGMPPGLNNLISPDEANTINAYYAAGALQDSVITRVQQYYPQLSAHDIRSAVTVSIVAYTPLTRVTATGPSPDIAAGLANVVALSWVRDASSVITNAYNTAYATLTNHTAQLTNQINTVTKELSPLDPKSGRAVALNDQLQGLETQLSQADNQLSQLQQEQYALAGNAWLATKANASDATRTPDIGKSVVTGGAVGLALGLVCLLWFARASLRLNIDIAGPALQDALFDTAPRLGTTSTPAARQTGGPASLPVARQTGAPISAPAAQRTGGPASISLTRQTETSAPEADQPRRTTPTRTEPVSYDN